MSVAQKTGVPARDHWHEEVVHAYRKITYHLYSIWLFTVSDVKTIILPSLAFALLTAPAGPLLGLDSAPPPWRHVAARVPVVLFWLWINLLPFNIDNQRQPDAVAEDALNKPWRTLPSRRMRPEHARALMAALYPLAVLASLRTGGLRQSLALIALGFWYNGLRGADHSCVTRNLINAGGFVAFASGALEVLLGGRRFPATPQLLRWCLVLAGIVWTTVQTQDMYDQAGDALRGRKTVPLVIGDGWARASIALAMGFWCAYVPWTWRAPALAYVLSVGLGAVIAARSLTCRSVAADKRTFLLWNAWLVVVYSVPLITHSYR